MSAASENDRAGLPVTVAEFRKNSRESVRVAIEDFKGTICVSVRVFYEAADGDMRPGRSGIGMAVKHLPSLADAISAALVTARARGLLPPEAG
jgi:hypothetical protein